MRGWLRVHLEAAQQLRKPLLLEEFGRKLLPPVNAPGGPQPADSSWRAQALAGVRDPVYSSTYDEVELALGAGQPLLGSLFWQLHVPVFADQGAGAGLLARQCSHWRGHVCLTFKNIVRP